MEVRVVDIRHVDGIKDEDQPVTMCVHHRLSVVVVTSGRFPLDPFLLFLHLTSPFKREGCGVTFI